MVLALLVTKKMIVQKSQFLTSSFQPLFNCVRIFAR
jgi:hypothetical protein